MPNVECRTKNGVRMTNAVMRRRGRLTLYFEQQDCHIDCVPNLVGSCSVKNIANEPMAMRGHCYEIDVFLTRQLNDLMRRLAKGKDSGTGKTFCRQLAGALFKISAV